MSFRAKLESYAGGYEPAAAYLFHRGRPGALVTDPHATRRGSHYRQPVTAAVALAMAKADLVAGTRRYPSESPAIGATFGDSDKLRWIERPAAFGLRFLGFADQFGGRRIEHTGWYTDSDGMSDVMRGALYALPGRDGVTRILAGYRTGSERKGTWTDQAGSDESAAVSFAQIWESEAREDSRDDTCDATRSAAYAADGMAESCAERERDYQESWQLGSDANRHVAEARDDRAAARELLAEIRGKAAADMPAVCGSIRATIRGRLDGARRSYALARDLWREHADGWQSDAFRDGAGAATLAGLLK